MKRAAAAIALLVITGFWPVVVFKLDGGVTATPRATIPAVVTPLAPVFPGMVRPERASRSVAASKSPRQPVVNGSAEPRSTATTSAASARRSTAGSSARAAMWQRLVDCEAPGRGWRYGALGTGIDAGYRFEGGPNFLPSTWRAYKPAGYPLHAYDATPAEQIVVAELVLADQGVAAWPTCGPRVGLVRR